MEKKLHKNSLKSLFSFLFHFSAEEGTKIKLELKLKLKSKNWKISVGFLFAVFRFSQ